MNLKEKNGSPGLGKAGNPMAVGQVSNEIWRELQRLSDGDKVRVLISVLGTFSSQAKSEVFRTVTAQQYVLSHFDLAMRALDALVSRGVNSRGEGKADGH